MKPTNSSPDESQPALAPAQAAILSSLAALVERHAPDEGMFETIIPGLGFLRWNRPTVLRRGVLKPSVCIVVQGRKKVQLGTEIINYGAGGFLASAINMPMAGQVVGATPGRPYLGVTFELPPQEIASVLAEARLRMQRDPEPTSAALVGRTDAKVLDVVLRCVQALDSAEDAAFLAASLKRELIYRLLTGPSGHAFYQSVSLDSSAVGIGRAIEWLKDHYKEPLQIEELAKRSHMSVSGLHHKFKAVTTMGPLQYQKQLRLGEARRLLISGLVDATSAAFAVGYESASQFSREYRRLFGLPPIRDAKKQRSDGDRGEL